MSGEREATVVRFPGRPNVQEEAGVWVMRIDRGLRPEERGELDAWLGADPAHVDALLDLARFWDQTVVAAEAARLASLQRQCVPPPRGRVRAAWMAGAAAAACAAVAAVFFWPTLEPEAPATARRYETQVGGQSTVHLPDASTVTLNTASALEVHYSAAERTIVMERGEAYFDVVSDPERPFTVRAGRRTLQALGTAFNVRLGPDDRISVMVMEGVVGVLAAAEPDRVNAAGARPTVEARVAAGSVASIDVGPVQLQDVGVDALRTRLSWQRGMLTFDRERLESVLAEVNRYTTVELVPDEALKDVRVGGYFRAGDIDGLLFALRENFGIESHRSADDRIELKRRD